MQQWWSHDDITLRPNTIHLLGWRDKLANAAVKEERTGPEDGGTCARPEVEGDKEAEGKPGKAGKAFLSFLARNPCADTSTQSLPLLLISVKQARSHSETLHQPVCYFCP